MPIGSIIHFSLLLLLDFLGLGLGQFLGGCLEAWSAVFSLFLLRLVVLEGAEHCHDLSLLAHDPRLGVGLKQMDRFAWPLCRKTSPINAW